jgi:hypothetical protein
MRILSQIAPVRQGKQAISQSKQADIAVGLMVLLVRLLAI